MTHNFTIGFLVEGYIDKAVIEVLAERLLGAGPRAEDYYFRVVSMGGKAAVPWAWSTVLAMLDEDRDQHVVLVLDADTTEPERIESQRARIEAMLADHNLESDEVSICFAVPTIEAWLLSTYEAKPEAIANAKQTLHTHLKIDRLTPEGAAIAARGLDLVLARQRAPSFNHFAETLDRIIKNLDELSAA